MSLISNVASFLFPPSSPSWDTWCEDPCMLFHVFLCHKAYVKPAVGNLGFYNSHVEIYHLCFLAADFSPFLISKLIQADKYGHWGYMMSIKIDLTAPTAQVSLPHQNQGKAFLIMYINVIYMVWIWHVNAGDHRGHQILQNLSYRWLRVVCEFWDPNWSPPQE